MVNEELFSTLYKKKRVILATLRNPNGMRVQITNYGAKIVSLYAPNKDGEMADVVLGFNTFEEWRDKETYFNAIIGRYANRIKNGRFALDGKEYQLATNNNGNALHGGVVGFNERVWEVVGGLQHQFAPACSGRRGELPGQHGHLRHLHADPRECAADHL